MHTPEYIDVHAHIAFPSFDADREAVLARMREKRVSAITVGTSEESSRAALALAQREPEVFATIGLHPSGVEKENFSYDAYRALAEEKKVVGIGECGLDYYPAGREKAVREKQHELFRKHIMLSCEVNKPLMLHIRPTKGSADAYEDALSILGEFNGARGNVHFFVGDMAIAERFFARGFTVSFTGVITFAREYDRVVQHAPLEMVLSETDCPFVAPVPFRGQRSEPFHVQEVVKKIAELRSEELEIVSKTLCENARRVFVL